MPLPTLRSAPLLGLALLLAAGCGRPDDEAHVRQAAGRALRGVLAYPGSTLLSVAAGETAGQLDLSTPAGLDTVTAWYREALRLNGWELRQDAATREGRVIYALKGERPLWITLRPAAGGSGTTYTLVGVGEDTTAADTLQRSGSSMSSKRIQRR
jgi:hypothetical protein